MNLRKGLRKTSFGWEFVLLSITGIITMVPIYIIFITAFKQDTEMVAANFKWWPESFTYLGNFEAAFNMVDWIVCYKNSFILTFATVVISLLINSVAGYSFARLKFKGKDFLFLLILVGLMVSPQSIIIPQFLIMKAFPLAGGNDIFGNGGSGLLNTFAALILPSASGSFGIFMCRQYYMSFPTALDEAARIDGCGPIKTYFHIYLPMSKTILSTLTIFKAVSVWNDFFYPLIMTSSQDMYTVQLGLQMFKGSTGTHYNWLMAATLVSILPMVLVYAIAQKSFVQGIATTGMKG